MHSRFLRSILILTVLAVAALAWPVFAWASPDVTRSIVAAGLIALANVIVGFAVIAYAFDKPTSPFMVAVFGGMGIRMAAILVALTLLLLNGFHALALALGLMGFYVMYMVAEIVFVLRELDSRPSGVKRSESSRADFLAPRTVAVNLRHVDARP